MQRNVDVLFGEVVLHVNFHHEAVAVYIHAEYNVGRHLEKLDASADDSIELERSNDERSEPLCLASVGPFHPRIYAHDDRMDVLSVSGTWPSAVRHRRSAASLTNAVRASPNCRSIQCAASSNIRPRPHR
jgi:hypothetical protein